MSDQHRSTPKLLLEEDDGKVFELGLTYLKNTTQAERREITRYLALIVRLCDDMGEGQWDSLSEAEKRSIIAREVHPHFPGLQEQIDGMAG